MESGEVFTGNVADVAGLAEMPADYRLAIEKIVASHAINELTGAQTFDEPAIRLAPTPKYKWLVSRATMEEYGHHVLFARLADQLGVQWERRRPLTLFDYPMVDWVEFGVIKAVVDLAEILQLEDLQDCTFFPLRRLAHKTMPEERFHVGLGEQIVRDLLQDPANRPKVQEALNRVFPTALGFFGRANSPNNALFQRWGLKKRTNEAMRRDYVGRVEDFCRRFGLEMPPIPEEYAVELAQA